MIDGRCPFTNLECDGGVVYPSGTVGCGYKELSKGECAVMADVPKWVAPRDFYNAAVMDAFRSACGEGGAS